MKRFIDDHGRVFGLINLIDLGIIMLLIILGIKIIYDCLPARLNQKRVTVIIGFLIRNAPPYVEESLVVGHNLFTDKQGAYLGRINAKNVTPAELLLERDGNIVPARSPRNLDLRLEIVRMDGRIVEGPAKTGIYLGKQVVRIGDRIQAHTRYTSVTGEIEYLKIHAKRSILE